MKKFLIMSMIVFGMSGFSAAQDTVTTSSGLKYLVISLGNGTKAEAGKQVDVHYTGYFTDGKIFDSSRDRNEPISFILGTSQVIKGWDEGIALMNVGDKYRFIIPPSLAYGSKGAGKIIPPDATLIFDVELMKVGEPLIPIAEVLMKTISEKDVSSAIDQYRELKSASPDKYDFREMQLNALGYQLLQTGKTKDAIKIFKLNVEQFPKSGNVYDSIGEAYMNDGNNKLAIENYKKSLELDPSNDNAKQMLKKLGQ